MKLQEALQEKLSNKQILYIAMMLGYSGDEQEIFDGYIEELEHKDVVDNHVEVVKIALSHLKEDPEYYQKLKFYMKEFITPESDKEDKKKSEKDDRSEILFLVRINKLRVYIL